MVIAKLSWIFEIATARRDTYQTIHLKEDTAISTEAPMRSRIDSYLLQNEKFHKDEHSKSLISRSSLQDSDTSFLNSLAIWKIWNHQTSINNAEKKKS